MRANSNVVEVRADIRLVSTCKLPVKSISTIVSVSEERAHILVVIFFRSFDSKEKFEFTKIVITIFPNKITYSKNQHGNNEIDFHFVSRRLLACIRVSITCGKMRFYCCCCFVTVKQWTLIQNVRHFYILDKIVPKTQRPSNVISNAFRSFMTNNSVTLAQILLMTDFKTTKHWQCLCNINWYILTVKMPPPCHVKV